MKYKNEDERQSLETALRLWLQEECLPALEDT
jgi:hypothetical protein